MKLIGIALLLCVASQNAPAQSPKWQQEMDDARRSAENGENTAVVVRPGSRLAANWPIGVHVFYNAPRPFCYAYVIPGEWIPVPGQAGMLRSKDGRALVNVTFVPPTRLAGIEGETILERGRNAAIRELERALRQPLVDASLVPFESTRAGTWRLKAAPIAFRDGRKTPFPLYIVVDLSPHTIAEINVRDSGADEELARQIIAGLRTTTDPECYLSDTERMLKAAYSER
jgi:hypothetical protein